MQRPAPVVWFASRRSFNVIYIYYNVVDTQQNIITNDVFNRDDDDADDDANYTEKPLPAQTARTPRRATTTLKVINVFGAFEAARAVCIDDEMGVCVCVLFT